MIMEDEYNVLWTKKFGGSGNQWIVSMQVWRESHCGVKQGTERSQYRGRCIGSSVSGHDPFNPASVNLKKPWELKTCTNASCNARKWNRDVNAAGNMLVLLYHRIDSMMAGNGCVTRPIGMQRKSSIQKETDMSNN